MQKGLVSQPVSRSAGLSNGTTASKCLSEADDLSAQGAPWA